jgi:hypothetical protein
MSMTVTHHSAQATQKFIKLSPVLWIAAVAMLIFIVLGCTVPLASFNSDDAQIKAMLVGP